MVDQLMHPVYLPFTTTELEKHFAPVAAAADGRHLRHFEDSLKRWAEHQERTAAGGSATSSATRLARQMEKDERFWIVSALMALFHRTADDAARAAAFAGLLARAQVQPPGGFGSWQEALAGRLHLFFEVNLPSPKSYQQWLRSRLDERVLVPYVREAATARGTLEGATKAAAMLLAEDTGVAVVFEAKVLSDVSKDITFDVARNQLARLVDVMLEPAAHRAPLSTRKPEFTSLVLVTPELFRPPAPGGLDRSRLYGWLMPAYRDASGTLLAAHLAHRDYTELHGVADRLGWATWEDFNAVVDGACGWLPPSARQAGNGDNPPSQ
ncbi:hypothetical protein ACOCJ4_13535 [Knoellia sp. CPCC 206435]|uniref:hypothetical protein n=1 Tax=Knoellia terrae TaxID=3404797 RepID=UPI003B427C8C